MGNWSTSYHWIECLSSKEADQVCKELPASIQGDEEDYVEKAWALGVSRPFNTLILARTVLKYSDVSEYNMGLVKQHPAVNFLATNMVYDELRHRYTTLEETQKAGYEIFPAFNELHPASDDTPVKGIGQLVDFSYSLVDIKSKKLPYISLVQPIVLTHPHLEWDLYTAKPPHNSSQEQVLPSGLADLATALWLFHCKGRKDSIEFYKLILNTRRYGRLYMGHLLFRITSPDEISVELELHGSYHVDHYKEERHGNHSLYLD